MASNFIIFWVIESLIISWIVKRLSFINLYLTHRNRKTTFNNHEIKFKKKKFITQIIKLAI